MLTTATAGILALASRLELPLLSSVMVLVYLTFLAYWLIIRGPTVTAGLIRVFGRYKALRQRRATLELEMQQLRQNSRRKHSTEKTD